MDQVTALYRRPLESIVPSYYRIGATTSTLVAGNGGCRHPTVATNPAAL
jgi:hypothetical protein